MTSRRRSTPWLLFGATLLSALPLGAILAAANPQPAGACSGIGFGCSLYGWDAAGFALVLLGIPYATALLVVLGTLAIWERLVPVANAVGAVGLAVPWVAVVSAVATVR